MMPPFALISSHASSAPRFMSAAMAAKVPVSGSGKPILIDSLLCARNTAGKARMPAPAAAVVRNSRRCMAASVWNWRDRTRSSGADDMGSGRRVSTMAMERDRVPPVPATAGHIGARVKRGDDPRLLTGPGRYVDDLTLPRMVHLAFVRSVHAHARLTRVNLEAARRLPGVVGVLTGEDAARLCKPYRGVLLHYKGMKTGAMLPLARERVRYAGEPIVALAAQSRAAAEDAAALVEVEYEPLPPLLTPAAALATGAPLIHPELGDNLLYETRLAAGDADSAFAAAHRVWTRTCTTGRHTGVPLEPRGLVADYEPAMRALTVWISTQVPHMMQAVLAELFGLPEHRLRVVAPDVGGSFGIKIHVYQDDMAACAMALTLGRPVKFVAARRESFLSDIHAREQTIRVDVAADQDGVLTAMRASIEAAVGPYSAYPRSSVVEGGQVLRLLPGPYRLRHYDAALRVVAQ